MDQKQRHFHRPIFSHVGETFFIFFHRQRWLRQGPVFLTNADGKNKVGVEQNQISSLSLMLCLSCAPRFLINPLWRCIPWKSNPSLLEWCEGPRLNERYSGPLAQRCREMVKGDRWGTTSGASLIADDSTWERRGTREEKEKRRSEPGHISLLVLSRLQMTQEWRGHPPLENTARAKTNFLPRQQKSSDGKRSTWG